MSDTPATTRSTREDWDAVIVGASLAGCSTAILLGRAGARVALVERQPDPAAYKRVCGHLIQSSAVPALERLGLMTQMTRAGAVRTGLAIRTPWGWIDPPTMEGKTKPALNLRREVLDPLIRRAAAETPGVELMLGRSVESVLRDDGRVTGVEVAARSGERAVLRAKLVIGADGRASKVARLAGLPTREWPHGRFTYGAYFHDDSRGDDPLVARAWMMDPDWAAAFPTDAGLVNYSCMPTMDSLPDFKRDLSKAFFSFLRRIPDFPPIDESRKVTDISGKISMPNLMRGPVAPGLALVGDAAVTSDPTAGVGCGWAFEAAERLADEVAPALLGNRPLKWALARYRRRQRLALAGHNWMINDYATGRRFSFPERAMFSAVVHDEALRMRFHALGARSAGPTHLLPGLPRIVLASLRHPMTRA